MKFNFPSYTVPFHQVALPVLRQVVLCSEDVSLSHIRTINDAMMPVTCTYFLRRAVLLTALTHTSTYFTALLFLMSVINICHT